MRLVLVAIVIAVIVAAVFLSGGGPSSRLY